MTEAREQGALKYNTGRPCKHGHYADRYAKSGSCVDCHRIWTAHGRAENKERYDTVVAKWRKDKRINEPEYFIYASVKSNAKKKGIPFDLTKEYIRSIWPEDNKCPITGMFLYITGRDGGRNYRDSASLDRLVPELGYVKGNVAIISMRANHMKNDVTDPEVFRRLADWLETKLKEQQQQGV